MSMPTRLGRYPVRRRIGSGGFATVWLAYDEQLDSPVAVKVLADNWTEDAHVRQRFLEEGRYLRRVESPHVVSVYDAGELEDGRPYLVMTYADQGTLADRLEVEGLTPTQAMEVVRQVGEGLHALHQRDILHRDVKPANVLFRSVDAGRAAERSQVRAMVGDLGLGKALDVSSRLTMIAGTPSYIAPEQAQAEPLDARADQYSLAALTHLMLAGTPAYTHATLQAAADPGPPPPLSTEERPFPEAVEAVVRRGLARERDDRFPDVPSFVAALAESLGEPVGGTAFAPWLRPDPDLTQPGARPTARPSPREEPVTRPVAAPRPRRSRRRRAGLALLGLVLLAGGGAAGFVAQRATVGEETLSDENGQLQVTVPAGWDRAVARSGWEPVTQEDPAEYPALSVGTERGWTDAASTGQGVFLGLLPGTRLPAKLPQHPECVDPPQDPVSDATAEGASVTVVTTGCPGGVTVERVVRVTDNRLLWVQIRSEDRPTANRVLDSVNVIGM